MKKSLVLLLAILTLLACKTQYKKPSTSVGLKGFYSYYNTIFNSKEALNEEISTRKKNHQDNYYAPYIRLLTTDEQPLGNEFDTEGSPFGENEGAMMGGLGLPRGSNTGTSTSILQISEAKALKAIDKYSVMKNGQQKNKMIFDAHILLAQSRLYMNKPLEALDAVNYLLVNMKDDKDLPLAKIYQALALTKMKDYYRAEELYLALQNDPKLKRSHARLMSVYYSEMLLEAGKYEIATEELEQAFALNKNRELRSRIAYLRGQILNTLKRPEEARESFTTAYKYANNFEFEVKSQIEIAKTFQKGADDYESAKKYIESISKKGTYGSRKNEFYYALGLLAQKAGKHEEADAYFRKSITEKQSDPQIRGLTFYEMGNAFFANDDYISAGAYYDSALAVMNYPPTRDQVASLSQDIKKITQNYYLIKKNDSILSVARMPEQEQVAYYTKYIETLKKKDEQEEIERRKIEREKGFEMPGMSSNSIFAQNDNSGFQDFETKGKGGFYFANTNTVSKGANDFKQIWGNRAQADNWRFSTKTASIEDVKNEAMGMASVKDPRRYEPNFYIEKLPKDPQYLASLKKDRDTASLGLGRMYENLFSKTELATKTLYDLVDNQPEDEVKLQALYQIFAMNYQSNPQAADRAKQLLLNEFPYTSYAEFVKNPQNTTFSASSTEVENAYKQAFTLYSEEKYPESMQLISQALEKYPKDALVPKFALLNAFNTGKTAGKEIMILQLEQIGLNYAKTAEGQKANEMLNYLKSDLSLELTDSQGNRIQSSQLPESVRTPQNEVSIPAGQLGKPLEPTTPQKPNTTKPNTNGPPKRPPTATSGFES